MAEKAAAKSADKAAEKAADKATETSPTPDAKPAKGGKGKMLVIIGVATVAILGGGGYAAWHFLKPPAEGAPGAEKAAKVEKPATGIVTFEPFVANLADAGGRRYARVSVRVIVGNEAEAKEIQENAVTLTRLRASILELLSTQTAEHIVTPDGRAELRKAIAAEADGIVKPLKVSDVLFADFVVQ